MNSPVTSQHTLGITNDVPLAHHHDHEMSAEIESAIHSLPEHSALLVVLRGPNQGARFLLDTDVAIVGRHPEVSIFLDDVTVSRKHAEFLREGKNFTVKDLGSMNGTYLAGERIEEGVLRNGDEVQVGKFRLTFYASPLDLQNVERK